MVIKNLMKPQISAVVCTKNEEKYLPECLEALKKQIIKPEIIIIDGHSTDKTLKIAKMYTNKIFFDEKKGIAYARNLGWKNTSSDTVAFCDADVRPPKEWTKNIIELLKNYDAVSGPLVSYDGGLKQKIGLKIWAGMVPRMTSFFGYNCIWGANMAFRKDVLKKESFKIDFLEDYELGRRLRRGSYKMKFSSKIEVPASSRRFSESFHRFCFKKYVLTAFKIKSNKKIKTDYWNKKY